MQRHSTASKQKTGARSRKNKNRKGFVGDKSRSGTDGVLAQWMYGAAGSWRCNGEPTQAAGPPEIRWSGSPGSIPAACRLVGKLCSAGVQSGSRTGRLPSTAAL